MSRFAGSSLRLALPLAAVLVFAVLLAFSLQRMFEVERGMRVEAEQNMLWVFHQSEVTVLRLIETVALAELGQTDPDELALRFDLLASRVALLNDGPQRRFLEHVGLDGDLDALVASLVRLAPSIETFTPAQGARLRQELTPLARFFGRAANTAMIAEWDELGGRLETYRDQLGQIILSLIGIMIAGGVLTITLFVSRHQSRQKNRMLRRERDFSGLLISSSGEGIIAIDSAGKCTLWNGAVSAILGVPAEQALGRAPASVAGFFDMSTIRQALSEALEGQTSILSFQPFFSPDSERPLYLDVSFFPMRNEAEIIGAIVFMHDASDKYAAQQKDAQDRDRLEELVAERTQELNNALKRERSAADLYRNFAAMVSHQFRTPLAVADSALQRLIRRGPHADIDEVAERAGRARNAISGLTRLVDSTLDAARLDAGQIGARRVQCDLADTIQTVCTSQCEGTQQRPIEITQETSGRHIAFCDPTHVEQVLANLLSNAVKYADPGTPVSVRLHSDTESLFCDVHNIAAPIPRHEQDQIFERNHRGANSIGVEGTGIGLFMARTLARMQDGEVSLLPYTDGVTFRMTLPRYTAGAS
ncbi:sensor histidine kinase [Lentibacter sp. XHP0401]|uniref:sensor histidine kinase n=1 Tax=Lentibacter sp. XHP0401 TaxID=2984334 RepID=UPI0021E72F02|nr:PAS domain-containing sensor histidine kinase [Lentibacter sp. XHP0401]MCV2892739.1 PAS domain-containing sensor histidine kinase [Lentibacter sp. XHP0401]